jgi:hypothetical protein
MNEHNKFYLCWCSILDGLVCFMCLLILCCSGCYFGGCIYWLAIFTFCIQTLFTLYNFAKWNEKWQVFCLLLSHEYLYRFFITFVLKSKISNSCIYYNKNMQKSHIFIHTLNTLFFILFQSAHTVSHSTLSFVLFAISPSSTFMRVPILCHIHRLIGLRFVHLIHHKVNTIAKVIV